MQKKNAFYAVMLMVLSAFASCTADKNAQSLFDGKNIDKWNATGDIAIENQILTLNNGASVTLKKGDYKNFELKLRARTVENGKGFIAFHTDKNGEGGYQVALNNDLQSPQWWTKTGSLLAVRNLAKSLAKNGEWFEMLIRVEGKNVQIKINDELVVDYTEPAQPYRTAEHASQVLSHGLISVRNTGDGALEFQNMDIAPIDDTIAEFEHRQQTEQATDETADDIIKLHQANFPVLDYHVHLKEDLTLDLAKSQSRKYGINYALAPNCGIGFPITNDEQVVEYLEKMKNQPFVQAMQGEGREWPVTFSKEIRDKFDYVFTDAMTFTDRKGNRTRLWMPDEVFIDNEQKYMDLIVEKIVEVMNEPMDVYVNPTFLPDAMNDRYDMFWTNARQNKVIEALVKTNKVLEINNRYKIPNKSFIEKAKAAGLKFTFGTNNSNSNFGKLEYCIQMMKDCGITAEDMYKPKMTD